MGNFDMSAHIYWHELSDGRADTGGKHNVLRDQKHTSPKGLAWVVEMPCVLDTHVYILPPGSRTVWLNQHCDGLLTLKIHRRDLSHISEDTTEPILMKNFVRTIKMMTNITYSDLTEKPRYTVVMLKVNTKHRNGVYHLYDIIC